MARIIDRDFIALLNRIHIQLDKSKATSQAMGKRRANQKGSSVEFSDYRRYIPGDDFRRIDWNALARFEKLFIKEYMQEREIPLTLFIDCSQSMHGDAKRHTAIKTAALFAFTALKNYDGVHTYTLAHGTETRLNKAHGSGSFYALADALENTTFGGDIDLNQSVSTAMHTMAKGNVVIISDFLYAHKLEEVLSKLAFKRQHVTLIHILCKDEIAPAYTDNIRFKDSENGSELDVDINEHTLSLYRTRFEEYLKDIKNIASKFSATHILVEAESGIDAIIEAL